jgi:hypothetical protein
MAFGAQMALRLCQQARAIAFVGSMAVEAVAVARRLVGNPLVCGLLSVAIKTE